MPSRNTKLTPGQRVCALEWDAASEKMSNFLRGTPGHPDLGPEEMARMFDVLESALLDLRRVFETQPIPVAPLEQADRIGRGCGQSAKVTQQ